MENNLCAAPSSDVDIFRLYDSCDSVLLSCVSFLKKHRNMFVNQHGGVKMALYSHDMTFLRKHERTRLFKTFK